MTGEKMIETAVSDAMITGGFMGALIMVLLFILSAMIATTVRRRQDRFERLEDEVYKLRTSVNSLEIRTKK
jgi:biopolymer transport protein ExbB/TolQ